MALSKGTLWIALAIVGAISSLLIPSTRWKPANELWRNQQKELLTSLHLSEEEEKSCWIDQRAAFDQTNGPVELSYDPEEHPERAKFAAANSTAWEQWEFDGTSDSADSGILINFTRDPSYHFFRQGNLRVELFLMLDGRPVLSELDFVDGSAIATCPGYFAGIWSAAGRIYRFDVPKDMSQATVQWATQRSSGKLTVQSTTPPFVGRGPLWPSIKASPRLSSSFSSAQPIVGGAMRTVYHDASGNKTFSGSGGHTRFWASDGWFKFAGGFNQIRATAGPYVLSYWQHVSRDDLTLNHTIRSSQLFHNGELLMSTSSDGSIDKLTDHVLFHPDTSGKIVGTGAPKVSGRIIEFVSPERKKKWHFKVTHHRRQFDMDFGNEKGLSGFTATVEGGEVGEELRYGSAFVEHTAFPTEFKQWQIWAVYAIHTVGTWWKRLNN